MDFDLPIAAHPPPVVTPLFPPTPRRSHLKQLSLAPSSIQPSRSPSSSSPSFPSSISPRPRSSTDGSFTNSTTPPLSPSPLSRSGSIGRNPNRRQSSISYSPNRASSSFQFASQQQPLGGSPLGLGLGKQSVGGGRSSLEGRRSLSENERSSFEEEGRRTSNELAPLPPPSSLPAAPSSTTRSGASSFERDPSDSLTLVEKHSDLLSYIAQKESKSLELREALAQNDSELASLKKKWSNIVSRSQSGRPSPSSTNTHLPTGSIPTSSAASLLGGADGGAGGLLSPESLQSGKRFLTSLLGVGAGGEEEDVSGEGSSSNGLSSSLSPTKKSNGTTTRPAPPRTSLDLLGSVVRSGLDMVSEAREEPSSPPPKTNSSLPPRPLALSSSSARSKRLSLMSSTSSSSSSTSSTAPSSLDLANNIVNPRGSSSQGGSFDSTTSSSSTSSSLFSLTPTDERSSAWGVDANKETSGREQHDHRLAGIGEDEEPTRTRDPRSLMEEMASSSGSSLSGGGWGKRWGDLATSLTGNEHFQSSKRATLGLASTLQSTLVTLSSAPGPTPVSHPLSSPSSHTHARPTSLFASPPIPSQPLSSKTSRSNSSKPNHSRHPSTTKMAPWDASHEAGEGGLQEPLVPVGRSPSPRIGPPSGSPQRKKSSPASGGSSSAEGGDDGWNW
ncbi:hypothetical protein BDY24DRAFT_440110 [Mrakia frigida]|uniref:uncharacterized protein n=1 Tax=Mrakia frigida TaxID=29902 RepID=UPI003FCBF695